MYAMDGLFGLPRKKSAGTSYRKALHGHLYFHNQIDVDQFVIEAQRGKQIASVSIDSLVYIAATDKCIITGLQ